MSNNNPLLDNDFLNQLNEYSEREVYVKIIALDMDENPMDEISGHVTQGSISLDGTSAIRRTCSLTMVAEDVNVNEYYWGLHTKVKISLGMKNFVNDEYSDIIWFPQGVFVLTTFTTSQNVQGYTINVQGKDKMCLLNGDIGGNITALSVDFGKIDEEVTDENGMGTGEYVTKKFLIKDIITEAVHTYAGEPYHNIIINDLDEVGLELMEYRGKNPLYLIIDVDTNEVRNMSLNGSTGGYYTETGEPSPYTLETIPENQYDTRTQHKQETTNNPLILYSKNGDGTFSKCSVAKITAGEVIGYRITDLTYAGDLIGSVGQSITNSVLDPIVKQLGDFEYFYNLEGQFIFQRKKTYVNTSFNTLAKDDGEIYNASAALTSSSMYTFENSNLITTFNNNPDLSNVKNDYSIWGSRKGVSGAEIPIHLRYAIDRKPIFYRAIDGKGYTTLTANEYRAFYKEHTSSPSSQTPSNRKLNSIFGLSDDWWEVRDWAAAWENNGLDIPTGNLGNYCHSEAVIVTDPDQDGKILDTTGSRPSIGSYVDSSFLREVWLLPQSGVYEKSFTVGDDIIFSPTHVFKNGHGMCAHPYTWWLEQFEPGGWYEDGYAFFFRPEVPEEILGDKEFIPDVDGTIMYQLDWRELIYQMAIDYFKYNQNEDFMSTVASNNLDLYPTGITGYEQYYTDIQGFWRQNYDITLGEIEKYNYTKVYEYGNNSICAITKKPYNDWTIQDFEEMTHNFGQLYYKQENVYKKASTWNPFLTLYLRDEDNATDHNFDTFYTLHDKSLVAHAEEEVIIPTPLYKDKTEIYYKNGTRYIPYVLYDSLPSYNEQTPDEEDPGGAGGGGDSGEIPPQKGDVSDVWIDIE